MEYQLTRADCYLCRRPLGVDQVPTIAGPICKRCEKAIGRTRTWTADMTDTFSKLNRGLFDAPQAGHNDTQ